ncbi:GerMN domain-containing protein [Paenibacillus sp. BR2-3]|uniref:GerMN domain-containing protein n=1 Tax=Paenibacillus sp. BR2-3 TaxID=3048494 RepID=UPI003977776E
MNTKLGYAGLSVLLLFVMSGCGDKPITASEGLQTPAVVSGAGGNSEAAADSVNSNAEASSQPTAGSDGTGTNNTAPADPAAEEKKVETIDVYYTDSQMMDLVAAKATISYTVTEAASKYSAAFQALQASDNTDLVPLWGKIELKSLKFDNGQVVIDIHKPIEAQLGAGGESFAMGALSKTLFQFAEVQSIEVLLDGEKVESLMGHVDLEHPMTRDNSL